MSINKKALTRYLAYDKCLRNRGRKWTWTDLVDAANTALAEEGLEGIGKTQFYDDIKYMELSEWKAVIEKYKDGRTVYYRYLDKDYTISNVPLNEAELSQMASAIQIMSRIQGMPHFEWVNEVIPALQSKFGLVKTKKEVLSLDSNLDYKGLDRITPIFNAIVNQRVLRIVYQDFKSPVAYELEFHPYYLKQFNSRWFVFGYYPARNHTSWNLALDRIQELEEVKQSYVYTEIDWESYFSDFVGVTKIEGRPVEIKLLIKDAQQAAYIETKPLHQTQKRMKQVAEGFETSINVIPNIELEILILSFGERIKVISPEHFQRTINDRLKRAVLLYE